MSVQILIVDDDPSLQDWIRLHLDKSGHVCSIASNGAAAITAVHSAPQPPDVVLLDLMLPDMPGVEVLKHLKAHMPHVPVIVITGEDSIDLAVECMKLGAVDFVNKPLNPLRLVTSVENALEQYRLRGRVAAIQKREREQSGLGRLVGHSEALTRAVDLMRRASHSDVTALLLGETGTGKEVAARAIHAESARSSAPYVAINCGALPEQLVESALFGHEKGAFTGAHESRAGIFETGNHGTVFLDEVGELPHSAQVKLLRVLQERIVQRVGSPQERPVDVRLIAATNRDLQKDVREGRLRKDLYYRLAVFPITLPALREREGDILLLANHFLGISAARHGRRLHGFTDEVKTILQDWKWPGNVRELQNVVERAVILEQTPEVTVTSLPDEMVNYSDLRARASVEQHAVSAPVVPAIAARQAAEILTMEQEERRVMERALERTDWNIQEAARQLGIGRATLYRRLSAWGIRRGRSG